MVITVDVGNSHIVVGAFSGNEIKFVARISTDCYKTEDEYAVLLKNILSIKGFPINSVRGAVLSSVVPPLNPILKKAIFICYNVDCLVVGAGVKTGINISTDSSSQVGADLVCAAAAAHALFQDKSCLILDMGTATKMIVVDNHGNFIGVSIIPGVGMGINSLSSGTAQLPLISLENPGAVIGKNTPECMKSGVVYGNASLVDGMIDRMNEEFGSDLFVIATGGYAGVIVPHCKKKIAIDDNLILKGLKVIYDKTKKSL